MTSSYLAEINHCTPAPDELRAEDPGKPTAGDLIRIGSIVRTSYGTGPYLVDRVTSHDYYSDFRAWSITGFTMDRDGTFRRNEANRFWINELVADWSEGKAVIRKLFLANDDVLSIDAEQGFAQDRRGQGLLL